jgi:hypothetical protein
VAAIDLRLAAMLRLAVGTKQGSFDGLEAFNRRRAGFKPAAWRQLANLPDTTIPFFHHPGLGGVKAVHLFTGVL